MDNALEKRIVLDIEVGENHFAFTSSVENALTAANSEIEALDEKILSAEKLIPDCDKLDYALAASSGALCGIIDIFLVGKPGESPIGDITDKWFADRTVAFAKLFDKDGKIDGTLSSAIKVLEKKFKIPYDQRGAGDAASFIFDLNPTNHHFKSLGHNPTIMGLFFSILDQFTNQSHFVSEGELISLQSADGNFELHGDTVPAKLFCGFVNWFGHLLSDVSGASGSKGRGMGIPSPFWAWTNDIIVIKRKLNIPVSQFDKNISELALNIYKQGYDVRFQTAQAIPVFINEIIVRLMYSIRRMIKYYSFNEKDKHSIKEMWSACEPFSNSSVKRMLTVAHGTFCLVDVGDATIRGFAAGGGSFNVTEFVLRLNIIGVGRFAISLYGEGKRAIIIHKTELEVQFAKREKAIVEDYLKGLLLLSELYEDESLVNFVEDFKCSDAYVVAFQKSASLAQLRHVPEEQILRNKNDIDMYFGSSTHE